MEMASVFGRKGSTTTPPNRQSSQIIPSSSTYHSLERSSDDKDDVWNFDYNQQKMDHHSLDRDNNLNRHGQSSSKNSYFQNIPTNFPRKPLNSSHSNISNESNEKTLNSRSGSGRFSTKSNPRFDKTPMNSFTNDQKYTISCSSNNISSNNFNENEIHERVLEQPQDKN